MRTEPEYGDLPGEGVCETCGELLPPDEHFECARCEAQRINDARHDPVLIASVLLRLCENAFRSLRQNGIAISDELARERANNLAQAILLDFRIDRQGR